MKLKVRALDVQRHQCRLGLRTSPINPLSAEGFGHIFCGILATIDIAAPTVDLLARTRNDLLLAPEL